MKMNFDDYDEYGKAILITKNLFFYTYLYIYMYMYLYICMYIDTCKDQEKL